MLHSWVKLFLPPAALLFSIVCGPASLDASQPGAPDSSKPRQLLLALAPSWKSTCGVLARFERGKEGGWQPAGQPVPVLFGSHGLAWGLGLHPPQEGPQKSEHDGKAPAGRFRIGLLFSEDPSPPPGCRWPYFHRITREDAWIDDPKLPNYNHLYTLPPGQAPPPWFRRERMKLKDPAYHWLLLIEHNYPDSVPGKGSAIFFHIRRGVHHPTAGCTTMSREALLELLLWLDPSADPQLVQLPKEEYLRLWQAWDLPPPEAMLEALAKYCSKPKTAVEKSPSSRVPD
jgi:L,D-peptidoglycan transpeptidase YkuD (ErfK/YbiS/YcfS/YnhG family)